MVDCEVQEKIDSPLTKKESIIVEDTGNIDAYLRVRFVSYWVRVNDATGGKEIVSKPSEMPEFEISEKWILGKNNTYYYKTPVSPKDFTEELLAPGAVIQLAEEDGYRQVIEVFAEAIQSKPSSYVENSWNVIVDKDGNIVGEKQ